VAEEKDQAYGSYGYTAAVRISFLFGIVSRRAAYVSNPPEWCGNRRRFIFSVRTVRAPVLEKCPNQPAIALSCFLLQLPPAALATFVSTRESILFRVPPFSQCFRGG